MDIRWINGLWQMTIQIKVLQLFVHFIMCCCQSPQNLTWHEYQSTIFFCTFLSRTFPFLSKVWDVSPCPTTLSSLSNLALLSTDSILDIRLNIVLKYQLLQKMIVNMCQYQKVLKIFQLIFAGFFCPGLKYW